MSPSLHKTFIATLLLLFFVGFSSCKEKEPELNLSLSASTISGEGGQTILSIQSEAKQSWILTIDPSGWLSAQPVSGETNDYGETSVILSANANTTAEERTANLTVTVGKASKSVRLKQPVGVFLDIVATQADIASTATILTATVKAKTSWTAKITEGNNFCTVTPAQGKGERTISLDFQANPDTLPRYAKLRVETTDGKAVERIFKQVGAGRIPGEDRPEQTVASNIELPVVVNKRWYVEHEYYAMEYDTAQRHALWVAYVLNANYLRNLFDRSDNFDYDPIIPPEFQSLQPGQSFRPTYDRGHLLPSADRRFSEEANEETFYFSNMSPQVSAFNQGIWATLEGYVRTWAAKCDTLYVVTGGAINKGVEIIGKRPDRNNVTIPKYYFKALVRRKGNQFDGIAFWLENKSYTGVALSHSAHSMTIRDLEELTGIDFFPNLDFIEKGLEERVETSKDITKWAL